ncbi:MAG TPA: class I SAM-dependent methyltransferase [Streptosporangiaceae bacterium]|nr:class I SAM-dependent methyltransferase [Streptosporangiaceae bacterium]
MRSTSSPFTDLSQVKGPLYASADRITQRTSVLHRTRVSGHHAADVIADLAARATGQPIGAAVDIGCGRGTTTCLLARRLPQWNITAVDLSAALLAVARSRSAGAALSAVRADFHHLPFASASCNLAVAAFCLYHSPDPGQVITEITRCLKPGGTFITAVKSAESYRELDHIMARSGLDPAALERPSLYQTAHSGNIEQITAASLTVKQVFKETHQFRFPALADVAEYLATSPKYELPPSVTGQTDSLAAALRRRLPDTPVTATSVVTYLTAIREASP